MYLTSIVTSDIIDTESEGRKMKRVDLFISTLNSENTKKCYRRDIAAMLNLIGKKEEDITVEDMLTWKESLKSQSTATMARKIASIKMYFNFLYTNKVIVDDPATVLKAPRVHNKEKDPLDAKEIKELLEAAKNPRDRAIISLMCNTGLRVSELVNIKLEDIQDANIVVTGKGNKQRIVHMNSTTQEYIHEYFKVRKDTIANLFVSNQGTKMNPRALNNTLKVCAKRAGIDKNIHNHLMRTTAATLYLDNDIPVQNIQAMLGHEQIQTTLRYAKIRNRNKMIEETMGKELW